MFLSERGKKETLGLPSGLSIRGRSLFGRALLAAVIVMSVLLCSGALVGTVHGASQAATSITLLPAGQSIPLNSSNGIWIQYVTGGVTYAVLTRGGTVTLNADVGTNVTIAGDSTGSGPSEEWVLDSEATGVSFAAGSTVTYYYYDILLQPVSYSVMGGGLLQPAPYLTYSGAPSVASGILSEPTNNTYLSMVSTSTIMPVRGSNITLTGPGSGTVERWVTKTTTWIASSSEPIPFPIIFFHQYKVSLSYSVIGGGTGYFDPKVTCSVIGSETSFRANGQPEWVDANTVCFYESYLPGSTQRDAWNLAPPVELNVTSFKPLTPWYYHQYFLRVNYTVTGGGVWSQPEFNVTVFGVPKSIILPAMGRSPPGWVDAGSLYSISNPLPSSTVGERWSTSKATEGFVDGPLNITATYYHQFLISAAYSVLGGGSVSQPYFNFSVFGQPSSITLAKSPQAVWADSGSEYLSLQVLGGSNSTVRWYAPTSSGVIRASLALTITYVKQFLLYIPSGPIGSAWFDFGTKATVTFPSVYARNSGRGFRVTWYSIDGKYPVQVPATGGNVTVTVLMDRPHSLEIDTIAQYQVALDGGAISALASITPPTIPEDNYWYDAGTAVSVVLNGVWGRASGSGLRLASYSADGVSTSVSATGLVLALNVTSIYSPHTVGGSVVSQYELATASGSVAAESPPTVMGDGGWYDSGTNVTISYNYSWNNNGTQRLNALSWQIDDVSPVELGPSGAGTFSIHLTMNSPHRIQIRAVMQFRVLVSGGSNVVITPSRTNDTFYDNGSLVSATTEDIWGLVSGNQRMVLSSFSVNGKTSRVVQTNSATFTTPSFRVTGPLSIDFQSVQQYLVSFEVKDGTGKFTIQPTSLQIQVSGQGVVTVTDLQVWLDKDANFSIYSLVWGGADVKPTSTTYLTVSGPLTDVVTSRVFEGDLQVMDYFGLPVSGAKVNVVFENGTTATLTTGSNGTVNLGMIPLGPYNASITSMGVTTRVTGDASVNSLVTGKVFLSIPMIVLIAVFAAAAVLLGLAWIRLRSRRGSPGVPEEQLLGENWEEPPDQP